MVTTPNLLIDHFELSGNPEVPINDALDALDGKLAGWLEIDMADANVNLRTTTDGNGDPVAYRYGAFKLTGANTAARTVEVPDTPGVYDLWNAVSNGHSVVVQAETPGAAVTVANGEKVHLRVEDTSFDVISWTPSVALALDDLTNVDEAGKQDGDALVYNSGSGDWEPGAVDTGLPPGYVTGFQLANNATDADHDLDIGAGSARDGGDTVDAALAATLVKQIDATWAEGTDAGGMFTGSVANDTWYHVVLIRQDSSGDVDAGFDTDLGGANKPSGWSVIRRLGSVLTDGAANILGFQHFADRGLFLWDDPPLDADPASATTGTTQTTHALSVPPGLSVEARLNAYVSHASAQALVVLQQPGVADEAPSASAGPLASLRTGASGAFQAMQLQVDTDTSSQIAARADQTSTVLGLATLGWSEGPGHGSSDGGGGGGGWQAVATYTLSGQSTPWSQVLSLTTGVRRIRVMLDGFTVSEDGIRPFFGVGAGGSLDTSSVYNSVLEGSASDTPAAAYTAGGTLGWNLASQDAGESLGNAADESLMATLEISNISSTTRDVLMSGLVTYMDEGNSAFSVRVGGSYPTPGAAINTIGISLLDGSTPTMSGVISVEEYIDP